MNIKIKWLRDKLKSQNIQGMIISNPLNIKYLTGIEAEGTLLLTQKENIYITDSRFIEMINRLITLDDEIIVYNSKDISKYDYENFFMFCENVGFEEKYVTYEQYKLLQQNYQANNLVETEGIIEVQRTIKEPDEIENIKQACKITDDCFEYITKFIKRGMTEKEIAFEMEMFMRNNGADGLAFDTIVASGPNASMPHAIPTTRKIREGDMVLLDFGCKYKGYCSDMTRTIFVSFADDDAKISYEFVKDLQQRILNDMKDGCNIKNISKLFETDLKIRNFNTLHALGHGVGLEIHEIPYFSTKYDNFLKENMVVAMEPGVYVNDRYGIRIEDTVLIEKNGATPLTKSSKELIIING